MFEALLGNVDADFVRYITHVEASAVEAIEEAEADDGTRGRRHERQRRGARRHRTSDSRSRRRRHCPNRATRSAATSRVGAARVGSTSSAMADPKAENALREALGTLEDLEARWSAAREYLKIDASRERHAILGELVADPNLWDDQDRAREVTTELGRLTNDLEQFDELRATLDDSLVLAEFSRESLAAGEADWSSLNELSSTVTSLETKIAALETQSLFSGPYDANDAIVELHAGAGGTDAQDWTEMLLRMYSRWAERRGFGVEIDEATEGQEAGLLSSTFIVKGRFAYGWLSAERGVHRLVRISPFDSQARRQTSFASLDVTPLLEDNAAEVEIDEKELRIDTYRSSGAGGQHVNKTDSAIRITHLPTNIVVSCQNERSQHQNRARAMQILEAKLAERARAERQAEMNALSGDRGDNAWGSQIRSYVQAPYQLVKDHRTDHETGNVDAVLDGDLDDFMEAELRRQRFRS
jgi:peptide chain release factor 2